MIKLLFYTFTTIRGERNMKIALIAHDKKKESMIILAKKYADVLKEPV